VAPLVTLELTNLNNQIIYVEMDEKIYRDEKPLFYRYELEQIMKNDPDALAHVIAAKLEFGGFLQRRNGTDFKPPKKSFKPKPVSQMSKVQALIDKKNLKLRGGK